MAVCDTPFDNVPQRLFGKAAPTHAVVYSDGSTALMRTEDFGRLDLKGFVDVRILQDEQVGLRDGNPPVR